MNTTTSLDPRIKRLNLDSENELSPTNSHLVTWEVFHQEKKGKQPIHAGIVHASSPELALVYAKEQYARRGKTTNLWVVKSSDVYSFSPEDEDVFATTPEKTFRDPASYKVRDKIEAYQKRKTA
jgi:ring-1,2-phenylacetyl-CoA epoxidase subunit PaaB